MSQPLRLATGEQLRAVMSGPQGALIDELLAAHGRDLADYAAATTSLSVGGSPVVVLQAHRIAGIDAAQTLGTWIRLICLGVGQPVVQATEVSGHGVILLTDVLQPTAPPVRLLAIGDVTWMIVAEDEDVVATMVELIAAMAASGQSSW